MLDVDGPKTVTATFAALVSLKLHLVAKERGAAGFIVGQPPVVDDCPDDCDEEVEKGSTVVLSVAPEPGSRFLGWAGRCAGARRCTVTVDADTEVTAFVGVARHRLVARVTGRGSVVAAAAGVRCPPRCSAEVRHGTRVALRATAASGWRFAGWSGACRTRLPCAVTMTAGRQVRARFERR